MDINGAYVRRFLESVELPVKCMEGDRDYNEVHSERYAVTIRAIMKIDLPPGADVLEIGAAPYGMSAWLASKFNQLSLANFAQKPRKRQVNILLDGHSRRLTEYGFNVEQADWPVPDEAFDFVTACEIVEHLANDPMALFAGVNRILRPGGYFLVSTPNAASIQNILKLGRLVPAGLAQHFRRPFSTESLYERHNREYNPFTIGDMMLAAGFEIFIMETDSAFPLFNLGYPTEQIEQILSIIGMPELRRDTINVVGRKVSGVVNRYPETHDLYIASDNDPTRAPMFASAATKTPRAKRTRPAKKLGPEPQAPIMTDRS